MTNPTGPGPEEILRDKLKAIWSQQEIEAWTPLIVKAIQEYASISERGAAIGFAEWLRLEGILQFDDHLWCYNDNAMTEITPNQAFDKYLEHLTTLNKKP